MTLLESLNRTPPVLVRAAAVRSKHTRDGNHTERIQVVELVKLAGIPRRTFQRLSYATSWDDVPVSVVSAFCNACGVDILREHPLAFFLKNYGSKRLSFLTPKQRKAVTRAYAELQARK